MSSLHAPRARPEFDEVDAAKHSFWTYLSVFRGATVDARSQQVASVTIVLPICVSRERVIVLIAKEYSGWQDAPA